MWAVKKSNLERHVEGDLGGGSGLVWKEMSSTWFSKLGKRVSVLFCSFLLGLLKHGNEAYSFSSLLPIPPF